MNGSEKSSFHKTYSNRHWVLKCISLLNEISLLNGLNKSFPKCVPENSQSLRRKKGILCSYESGI